MSGISGAPVARASVILTDTSANIRTAATDDGGRFVFRLLPAGRYSVSVSSNGFAVTSFGGSAPRAVSIDLEDGDHVDRGDLVLPVGVAIGGRILDEHGNPLKGATVSAWRLMYRAPGDRRLSFEGQALSDDAGDYRIVGLKPGMYFVDAKAGESMAPTFFPATTSATMATAIRVTVDIGASGISIQLLSTPLARVSGSIINSQGLPSAEFFVLLTQLRADGAQVEERNLTSDVDAAGKFSVDKVPPGNYEVQVVTKSRLEQIGRTGGVADGIEGRESGTQPVTVDGRNIEDLLIQTSLPTRLFGKVTLDGAPISAELAKRLSLRVSENSGPSGMRSVMNMTFATPSPDGTFTIPAIPGGRLLRADGLPAGVAIRQILVNGIDVTDEGFNVGNSEIGGIVVALTSKPSQLTGRVSNSQGALMGNVAVIVFPAEERRWQLVRTRLIKSVKTDKNGWFTLDALPPGSYYAVAALSLVDGEWAGPANLEKLRPAATAFKLGDGESKMLTLTVKGPS